jgi:general nucleoside transport system ATP-binding protein
MPRSRCAGRDSRPGGREWRRQEHAHAPARRHVRARWGTLEVNGRDVTGWTTHRGDRRRGRHGAPALHARAHAHRGRERGAGQEPRGACSSICTRRGRCESLCTRKCGLHVDPRATVSDLTVGEAQRVEILKALYRGAQGAHSRRADRGAVPAGGAGALGVLRTPARRRRDGRLITHKLDEVIAVSDTSR